MIRRATLILTSLFLIVTLPSCDPDLNQVNPNQLTTGNYYQTEDQLSTGVASTYANLTVTGTYKRRKFFVFDALSGVVAAGGGQTEQWIPAMINWSHAASNSGITLLWTGLYQGIKRANLVVEQAPNVEGISEALRNRYVAEARFLRGLYYHKLLDLWGGVPVIDSVKTAPGGHPRASEEEVYNLIASDLDFARDHLPASYGDADVGRATSTAAHALLGRVELAQGNYGAAQAAFEDVMTEGAAPGGGTLQLVGNYFDNFREDTENNDESIFEIQFAESSGGNAWNQEGGNGTTRSFRNQEYGFLQWRNVVASRSVLEEMGVQQFDAGTGPATPAQSADVEDPRVTDTFYFACDTYNGGNSVYTTANNPAGACGSTLSVPEQEDNRPSWKKYQVYYREARTGNGANSGINFRELRYAEVLLGLAEAYAQQGVITGGPNNSAVGLMNQVRARVGLDGYNAGAGAVTTQAEAMDALYHEYVMEFTGEPALLHFLLRNPEYLPQLNPNVQNSGIPEPYLLPIPLEEIDNNPAISASDQNPGYSG